MFTLQESAALGTHRVLPFVEVQVPRKVLAQRFVKLWPWQHGHGILQSVAKKLLKALKRARIITLTASQKSAGYPLHPSLALQIDSSAVCSKITDTGAKCLPQTNFVLMVVDEVVEYTSQGSDSTNFWIGVVRLPYMGFRALH